MKTIPTEIRIESRTHPKIVSLLAQLKEADLNGWAVITDGSSDFLSDAELIDSLNESLTYETTN